MARITPMVMPAAMAITVSSKVMAMPRKTGAANRYLPTTPHWKRPSTWVPLVTRENSTVFTSMATASRMTAPATHRPGCRTETTFNDDGSADPSVVTVEPAGSVIGNLVPLGRRPSAGGAVDRRGGHGAGLDAPLVEDLLV